MRVKFDMIWEIEHGMIFNKTKIRCSGITAEAGAVMSQIGRSLTFGGVDWTLFLKRDLEVESMDDAFVIKGIY